VVFHSGTKYLAGHSDVTAGVLATRVVDERWEDVRLARTLMGGVIGPFESWLLFRGNADTYALHFEALEEGLDFEGLSVLLGNIGYGLRDNADELKYGSFYQLSEGRIRLIG
ncbi:MAG: hypothetical protein CMH22_05350, partial [Methylophaga sp.]|nr:hypothetical protein [Methylophaga sp.]